MSEPPVPSAGGRLRRQAAWSRRAVLGRAALGAAALAVSAGAAACGAAAGTSGGSGSGSSQPATGSGATQKLTVDLGGSNGGSFPLWMAANKGYFRAEGLDVTLNNVAHGTEPLGSLTSGKAQFAGIALDLIQWDLSCCSAVGHHADAAYIAAAYATPVFSVIGAGAIRSVADLRGKTVTTTGDASSAANYALRLALAANRVPTSAVRVAASTGGARTVFQSLKGGGSGAVEAAVLPPPMSLRAVQQGLHLLADASAYGKLYPEGWLAVDRTWAAAHRSTVVSFVRAYARGLAALKADPAAGGPLVSQYSGIGQPDVAKATYRAYAARFLPNPYPPVAAVDEALVQLRAAWPKSAAQLRGATAAQFIDTQYLKAAGVAGG